MILHDAFLAFLLAEPQICNPGPPPLLTSVEPANAAIIESGTKFNVVVDTGKSGMHDAYLQIVPTAVSTRRGVFGYGALGTEVGRWAMTASHYRLSATIESGPSGIPAGDYALLVTFSIGEGDCMETYSNFDGIVRIHAPRPRSSSQSHSR